jgi:hypothetical protein
VKRRDALRIHLKKPTLKRTIKHLYEDSSSDTGGDEDAEEAYEPNPPVADIASPSHLSQSMELDNQLMAVYELPEHALENDTGDSGGHDKEMG